MTDLRGLVVLYLEQIKGILEIGILWVTLYKLIVFTKSSRAYQALRGLILLVCVFFAVQLLGFETLSWILTKLFAFSIVAFLIVFQPELRSLLVRLGQGKLIENSIMEEYVINEIADAVSDLSAKKTGALIAIERETGLAPYLESGIELDSKVTSEMVKAIFVPHAPLHDGAVIIVRDRIKAATCLFPLSQNPRLVKNMGTRHLAALGLSEESDAICVVVSEETGGISVASEGKMVHNLTKDELVKTLRLAFKSRHRRRSLWDIIIGVKR